MVVTVGAAVALSSLGLGEAGLPFAAVIAFYSVAAHARRRTRLVAFLLLGVGLVILLAEEPKVAFIRAISLQTA